jgi:hypothetical protein
MISALSRWPHTAGAGRDGSKTLRYRTTGPKTGQAATDLKRITWARDKLFKLSCDARYSWA